MNWRGRPLTSHEVIVQTIAATTTRTGLTVNAELDTGTYPGGIKISATSQMKRPISQYLDRHDWHGEWNYTLHPAPPARVERVVHFQALSELASCLLNISQLAAAFSTIGVQIKPGCTEFTRMPSAA